MAEAQVKYPGDKIVRFFDGPGGYSVIRIDADGWGHELKPTTKRRRKATA